ncbi:MAG: DUF4349 domain-containing protein [Caldilineaceae bacterium]
MLLFLAVVAGCAAQGGRESAAVAPVARPAAGEAAPMESDMDSSDASGNYADAANAALDTRKIIATAQMDIVVDDTEVAVTEVTDLATDAGGYVSNANLYRDTWSGSNLLRGTLTLRIPADRLGQFMAQLETIAVVVRSSNLDRQDVTDQYSDIEAQLRNLTATENELRELLAEVRARPNATAEDILAVHRDLSDIRGQIEQLQGRQNMLDNQIALSTIDVTLTPDEANRPVVEEGWQPGTVLRNATRALVSSVQFIGSAMIWILVYVLPIVLLALIPLALLVWLVRTIVVRRRRKRGALEESTEM